MGKNLPAMWETRVGSLGQEDPLEEGMATHSSILAWRIPWTEEPGGLQSMGLQRYTTEQVTLLLLSVKILFFLDIGDTGLRKEPSFFSLTNFYNFRGCF